ncbi:MAG: translation elongation factor Ts [bacterium]
MDPNLIKELREKTFAGILDCKAALEEAGGNIEKAIVILREKGKAGSKKLEGRSAKDGAIFSYIHHSTKLGVLLELNCETDFVAKTEEFKTLGKELCLQIAASNPLYISENDVPANIIEEEKNIIKNQFKDSGKPEAVLEKIASGRLSKFFEENCLLDQPYIREPKIKIKDLILETQAKFKEKLSVSRFAVFKVGG